MYPRVVRQLGMTALMQAARNGHTDMMPLLLDGGADVNIADFVGAACA